MPTSPAPSGSRAALAGGVRLAVYLGLGFALMVLDQRGGWLNAARERASIVIVPVWRFAALPAQLYDGMRESLATRTSLIEDNHRLRQQLMTTTARQARLEIEAEENARLRGLLGAGERNQLHLRLAPILDADLDPARQRLLLAAGARAGVAPGSSVIDAGGLLGQVIAVTANTASVLLVTDLDHAVPALVTRSGMRLIVWGSGRSDRLELRNIPLSGDIAVGDTLVTSGLGGRFPPGFVVGTVIELHPDASHTFLAGTLAPAAQPDHGRDVLVLRQISEDAPDDDAGGGAP